MSQTHRNLGHTYMETKQNVNTSVEEPSKLRFNATTIKLDDVVRFIRTNNVVMKIDVESYECNVINSGKTLFAMFNGTFMFVILSCIYFSYFPNHGMVIHTRRYKQHVCAGYVNVFKVNWLLSFLS
jgi:hypothetical protein